jgi:hypothetical protein
LLAEESVHQSEEKGPSVSNVEQSFSNLLFGLLRESRQQSRSGLKKSHGPDFNDRSGCAYDSWIPRCKQTCDVRGAKYERETLLSVPYIVDDHDRRGSISHALSKDGAGEQGISGLRPLTTQVLANIRDCCGERSTNSPLTDLNPNHSAWIL